LLVDAGSPLLRLDHRPLLAGATAREILFDHATAKSVVIRHDGNDWANDHVLHREGGVWRIPVHDLGWTEGHYEFKFLVDDQWEEGGNRYAYVNREGNFDAPPAVYLTWQRDPTTTMTVHWYGLDGEEPSRVAYQAEGEAEWQYAEGTRGAFPFTPLYIHTVEITGLVPGSRYRFRRAGQETTYLFATLPSTLDRPLRFIEGGDVFHKPGPMDRMNEEVGRRDPAFVVIGGDFAYADGKPENAWRWLRMLSSFYHYFRGPDGRMIPIVAAIGNHETRRYYLDQYDPPIVTAADREGIAPFFYSLFAFPGQPGYAALDIGDYLSFLLLDTFHANTIDGEQLAWMTTALEHRRMVPHVFPVIHVPAYPSVRNPDDPLNRRLREAWVPRFEQAGVRIVFEHHDHAFKITHPIRDGRIDPEGIVYLGDGAWSVDPRTPATPEERWYLRISAPVQHVFELVLEPHQRTVRAIDINGQVLDEFVQPVGAFARE
jgi:hypothetical protein